jgi:tripartite motif-containing protein 71
VLRFGARGINPGEFNDPRAITIGMGGTLFVADYQGGRVQRFDAGGSYLGSWELEQDRVIKAMAADRNNNLYVVQAGDLKRYDQSSGSLLGTLDYQSSNLVAFDDVATATNGDVVAVNHFGELVRFDSAGNLLQLMPIEDVADAVSFSKVAVDGVGNVYVLGRYEDALGDRHDGVFIFNNRGQFVQRFGQKGDGPGDFTSPATLAVDGQGRIYVSDFPGILVFANSGSYLKTLPDEGFIFGMVVNDAGELVATGNANQVVKYARLE